MKEVPVAAPSSSDMLIQVRRRRLKRLLPGTIVGAAVAAFTYGALAERVNPAAWHDLLPAWLEAVLLGTVFALASIPIPGAIIARALIPVPAFLLYLTVLLGKGPSLPYFAAFSVAIAYAGALTVFSTYLADRPDRSKLGSRR